MRDVINLCYSNKIKMCILLGELDIDNLLTELYKNKVISDMY